MRKRGKVAQMYNKKLRDFPGVELPFIAPEVKMSWFVYVVRLSKKYTERNRNKIIVKMAKRGIQCRNYFQPIHHQPFYKKKFSYKVGDFPVTESVSQRTIALPFYNSLREKEINYVVRNFKKIITNLK